MTTDELVDRLLSRHDGQRERSLAAWAIGYINRLEYDLNKARSALGCDPVKTLMDNLNNVPEPPPRPPARDVTGKTSRP